MADADAGARVYIAAPLSERRGADYLGKRLSELGFHIVSSWHEAGRALEDPLDPVERLRVAGVIARELCRAECLVALTDDGKPRATFSEIGWALARGIPVVWVQGPDGEGANVLDGHWLVTVTTDRDAVAVLLAKTMAHTSSRGDP